MERFGDQPWIRNTGRAAKHRDVQGVGVTPGRDIEADAFEDRTHRVDGLEHRLSDVQPLAWSRHIRKHEVDRRPHVVREAGSAPRPHDQGVQLRRNDVGSPFEEVVSEDERVVFGRGGHVMDVTETLQGVGDVSPDRDVQVVDVVAAETGDTRIGRDRDARYQRAVGNAPTSAR